MDSPADPRSALGADPTALLQRRGLQLRQRDAGNYNVDGYPGLIVKDSATGAGPSAILPAMPATLHVAIDFCMKVLGLSFHDAMREITRP